MLQEDYSWVPKIEQRYDWHPGKPWESRAISFREADPADLELVSELLHKKPQTVFKWLKFNGFSVRLAVRNLRNPVGIITAKHEDEENRILASWFSSRTFSAPWPTGFAQKLVQLVSLEQPEVKTVWTLDAQDAKLEALVRSCGFRMSGFTEGERPTNTWTWNGWEPKAIPLPMGAPAAEVTE